MKMRQIAYYLYFSQKHKAEAETQALKEQVRKLEQEVEKWQNEVKRVEALEEQARVSAAQQMNRVHFLQKLLDEAKEENKELQGTHTFHLV